MSLPALAGCLQLVLAVASPRSFDCRTAALEPHGSRPIDSESAVAWVLHCFDWADNPGFQMHAGKLREYAAQSTHITEIGVNTAASTWALLRGLYDGSKAAAEDCQRSKACRVHRAIDIRPFGMAPSIRQLADALGIDYTFQRADSLSVELEETDLLFIDTFHAYAQLRAELRLHAHLVRPGGWIVLHDTTLNGEHSQCGVLPILDDGIYDQRRDHCLSVQRALGVRMSEVEAGLWAAIEEFLSAKPEWSTVTKRNSHLSVTHNEAMLSSLWDNSRCRGNFQPCCCSR
eukprot:TRINITY_DN23988_c0_g1_i1.p1 TRINITY_DN23988_c0_g1~~TRINITY_DN23988_c0_g1_i1.p1  ORF type:complete len:288 (+),score=15.58 TRINITY_DN23988_c0_g1_i1:458-1321(+)